jgi:hypothetical protein
MLNLVQAQEQLKGLPMDAVMQYANGQNPMIPPYVALAELNRRKEMQAAMPLQQPPADQQPTVADQVKQAVMAPMQDPVMMGMQQPADPAQGGVAGIAPPQPGMAGGGLVAFAEGGDTGYRGWGSDKPAHKREDFEDDMERNPIMQLLKRLMAHKAAPIPQGPPNMTQADRVVESYGPGESAPAAPAQTQTTTPASGVSALPSSTAMGGGRPAPAAPAAPRTNPAAEYERLMKEFEGLFAPTTDDQKQAKVMADNQRFGITEPGGERDARMKAMEAIMRQREAMYESQKARRPEDNKRAMMTAFAQANPFFRYGSASAKQGELTQQQDAADLANEDKKLEMNLKLDELYSLNEAKKQAWREGNMAKYLALDQAEKAKQAELLKMKADFAGKQYEVERKIEGDKEVEAIRGQNQRQVAGIYAGARGNPNSPEAKREELVRRAAHDVDTMLDKNMQFKLMPPQQQQGIRERMIAERVAQIEQLAKRGPQSATMPGTSAPATPSGPVDFNTLK